MTVLRSAPLIAFAATTNPDRARTFYGQTLGLPLTHDDGFALVFDANGTMLRLTRVDALTPAPYTVLGWQVGDIETAVAALSARGVSFERYAGTEQDEHGVWSSPGGGKVAWFKDPDGNLLSLSQPA